MAQQPSYAGVFLLNPANRKFLAREKRRIGSSPIMFLIIAVVVLIGGAGAYLFYSDQVELDQLARLGKTVTGEMVSSRTSSSRSGTTYYISYTYEVNGRDYQNEDAVNIELYNRVRPGRAVEINYVPSNPFNARLVENTRSPNYIIAFVLTAGITGAIVLALFLTDRRNRRLSRRGKLLTGRIVHATNFVNRSGYNLQVDYTFNTPEGVSINKRASRPRRDLRKQPLPTPGTPVAVLYVNEKVFRLL